MKGWSLCAAAALVLFCVACTRASAGETWASQAYRSDGRVERPERHTSQRPVSERQAVETGGHPSPGHWGFAIGLYPIEASERGWVYPPELREVVALGSSSILLTPSWSQEHVDSVDLASDADTPSDEALRSVMDAASERGMRVALMPYVRVRQSGPGQWRGALRPRNARWWSSYTAFITHYAELGEASGASVFVIGSELTSLSGQAHASRWRSVSVAARSRTRARLAFVSNHDALDLRAPLAFVDVAGVSAYFPCDGDADASWEEHARTLRAFSEEVGKDVIIFELGFPSRSGALRRPWDHIAGTPVDLQEQATGYRAALAALMHEPWLDGLFFWSWYGGGGAYDRGYSPRNKPALVFAKDFLRYRTRTAP